MKGKVVSLTTDLIGHQLLKLRAHFIDEKFDLYAMTLKCVRRNGRATADDICTEVCQIIEEFDLTEVTAIVTDTCATMRSVGRLLAANHHYKWHGCVDHILELTTGLAFDDTNIEGGDAAMRAARALVQHFNNSAQATQRWLQVQIGLPAERRVKVFQDKSDYDLVLIFRHRK